MRAGVPNEAEARRTVSALVRLLLLGAMLPACATTKQSAEGPGTAAQIGETEGRHEHGPPISALKAPHGWVFPLPEGWTAVTEGGPWIAAAEGPDDLRVELFAWDGRTEPMALAQRLDPLRWANDGVATAGALWVGTRLADDGAELSWFFGEPLWVEFRGGCPALGFETGYRTFLDLVGRRGPG